MNRGYLEDRAREIALLLGGTQPEVRRLCGRASDLELQRIISQFAPENQQHYDLRGRRRQS